MAAPPNSPAPGQGSPRTGVVDALVHDGVHDGEPDTLEVRDAVVADADAIATVHIASWRGAYAGIVPAEYLAALDQGARADGWRRALADPSVRTWVATAEGRVVGFASLGPGRDEDAEDGDLELYAIYLDPEMWGRGVARSLLRTVLLDVPPRVAVSLWVIAENERAQRFYRRHGFQPDGVERLEELGGSDVLEVRFRRS